MPVALRSAAIRLAIALLAVVAFLSLAPRASAETCSTLGQVRYQSSMLSWCDGSNWKNLTGSTQAACATAGQIRYVQPDVEWCNGSAWQRPTTTVMWGCLAVQNGTTFVYNGSLIYCNGTNWMIFVSDPCIGSPAVGDVCANGAVYIGNVDGQEIYGQWPPPNLNMGTGAEGYCSGTTFHGSTGWFLPSPNQLVAYANVQVSKSTPLNLSTPTAYEWFAQSNQYWNNEPDKKVIVSIYTNPYTIAADKGTYYAPGTILPFFSYTNAPMKIVCVRIGHG